MCKSHAITFQALVIAGIGDMARPAEKLSASQSTALAATGKYHSVIVNYFIEDFK